MEIKRTPLPTTLEEAWAYARITESIVPWTESGRHIPLTCRNHPELRWSTKNLDYIGARTIFFNLGNELGYDVTECSCPRGDLAVVIPDDWQDKIVPIPICHCQCCDEETQEYSRNFSSHCADCRKADCWRGKGSFFGKKVCAASKVSEKENAIRLAQYHAERTKQMEEAKQYRAELPFRINYNAISREDYVALKKEQGDV